MIQCSFSLSCGRVVMAQAQELFESLIRFVGLNPTDVNKTIHSSSNQIFTILKLPPFSVESGRIYRFVVIIRLRFHSSHQLYFTTKKVEAQCGSCSGVSGECKQYPVSKT